VTVAQLLARAEAAGVTIATAESCTGGMVAAARTAARPGAPNSTVSVRVGSPRQARPKQTRPSGLNSEPPGPAMPVTETAICTGAWARAPSAISRATSSETAPNRSSASAETPSSSRLAALE
jgi:nicotinamide-nucleotide amidase